MARARLRTWSLSIDLGPPEFDEGPAGNGSGNDCAGAREQGRAMQAAVVCSETEQTAREAAKSTGLSLARIGQASTILKSASDLVDNVLTGDAVPKYPAISRQIPVFATPFATPNDNCLDLGILTY